MPGFRALFLCANVKASLTESTASFVYVCKEISSQIKIYKLSYFTKLKIMFPHE